MKPVKRADHNCVYLGPAPGIGDLSCRIDQDPAYGEEVVSHWEPSEDELAILNAGGVVELGVLAKPLPPVRVGVETNEYLPPEIETAEGSSTSSSNGPPGGTT